MIPATVLTDVVTVRPYDGAGAYGPLFGDPVDVRCRVSGGARLIRDERGEQIVLRSVLMVQPKDAPLFAVGSKVTIEGRDTTVFAASRRGLRRAEYVEVTCS